MISAYMTKMIKILDLTVIIIIIRRRRRRRTSTTKISTSFIAIKWKDSIVEKK